MAGAPSWIANGTRTQEAPIKVTFILRTGATIDSIIPEAEEASFSFLVLCSNMRINGFVQTANMHIRYEELSSVLFATDEAPTAVMRPAGQVLQ